MFLVVRPGKIIGIEFREAKDAAQHSAMHRAAPTTKNHPAQNVNRVNSEKPCIR